MGSGQNFSWDFNWPEPCAVSNERSAKLNEIKESLINIKEKIALAQDTCCFASVDIDYDEFDKLVRDLDDIIEELKQKELYES